MSPPDPLAEAQQRLAHLEQEYREAQVRSVALAGELLKVQNELSRLHMSGRPDRTALTLGRCESCYKTLVFTDKDWFRTCSCAYRTLHPQRHGELTARKWTLIFHRGAEGSAGNWRWSLQYWTPRGETPPAGSVRVKLWSEAQGWVFIYGAARGPEEQDGPARERTHTWYGSLIASSPAMDHRATRAFVEPWYGAYGGGISRR